MRHFFVIVTIVCFSTVLQNIETSANAATTIRDDLGYTRLKTELGAALPTGAGVPVTIVESGGVPGAPGGGKTLTVRTYAASVTSHANSVQNYFYAGSQTLAPGITTIDAYTASDWDGAGFLSPGTPQPNISPNLSRVANHSYVYTSYTSSFALNLAHRMDWLVATDDYIQVVGSTPGSGGVGPMGMSFNAIAVGRSDGNNAQNGTDNVGDSVYAAGRTKPDIVAVADTSTATPIVSGAAAMLIQAAHTNTSWSDGSYVSLRTSQTIYHAETAEVIKAALMAGADRTWQNSNPFDTSSCTDYRAVITNQTANGLDKRYGAGQLDIYNSYHIIAAGEQDSVEDNAGSGGNIGVYGFDYDQAFGGASGSNTSASYYFTTVNAASIQFMATLAWNVDVDGGTPTNFNSTTTLDHMVLSLYDMTAGGTLVGQSASLIDNTQNLWLALQGGHRYMMQVTAASDSPLFSWDYGLAWQMQAIPEPTSLMLLGASCGVLSMRRGVGR